jgi:hypothetical protein
MLKRMRLAPLALVLVWLFVSGCGDKEALDRLRNLPEGQLAPPGAVLVDQRFDDGAGLGSDPSAERTYSLKSFDIEGVVAFYEDRLAASGWLSGPRLHNATTPGREWRKGPYRIVLAPSSLNFDEFIVAVTEN